MQTVTPEDKLALQAGNLHFPDRSYSLFDLLRHWTYTAIHDHMDCNAAQWEEAVIAHAMKLNENLAAPEASEDAAEIAKKAARWTRQTFVMSDPLMFKLNQRLMAQRRHREAGKQSKEKPTRPRGDSRRDTGDPGTAASPLHRESWPGSRPMWRDGTL